VPQAGTGRPGRRLSQDTSRPRARPAEECSHSSSRRDKGTRNRPEGRQTPFPAHTPGTARRPASPTRPPAVTHLRRTDQESTPAQCITMHRKTHRIIRAPACNSQAFGRRRAPTTVTHRDNQTTLVSASAKAPAPATTRRPQSGGSRRTQSAGKQTQLSAPTSRGFKVQQQHGMSKRTGQPVCHDRPKHPGRPGSMHSLLPGRPKARAPCTPGKSARMAGSSRPGSVTTRTRPPEFADRKHPYRSRLPNTRQPSVAHPPHSRHHTLTGLRQTTRASPRRRHEIQTHRRKISKIKSTLASYQSFATGRTPGFYPRAGPPQFSLRRNWSGPRREPPLPSAGRLL